MLTGKRFWLLSLLLAAACLLFVPAASRADDPATHMGSIDDISNTDSGIYCDVTVQGELSQPQNSELSTGTADPSQIMAPGATPPAQLAVGMPVRLIVTRQDAVFRFDIGVVDSVTDDHHCTIRVDPAALEKTFQDPVNDNQTRKAGEFLKVGATVAIWVVAGS